MTTKISGDNLQANIAIDTTGDQVFNGTLKLDGNFPTGTNNVALGNTALDNGSLTGSQNVAIGSSTLTDTDTGADNTAVGFEALKVVTSGTNNTAIGSGAGSTITSGSNLTLVGYNATPSAIDATNEITLGDANVTDVRIPGPGIYVDSTGLGIGTASPSTKLDVSGTANVSGNVTFGADLTVDTNTLYVDSADNRVGIGTSSPASKLEVEDSVNGDMHLRINNTNTGSSARTFLLLQSDGATGSLYLNGANSLSSGVDEANSMTLTSDASASNGLNINTTSGSMKFYYNYSEKMRIDSSGNVGIGNSTPSSFVESSRFVVGSGTSGVNEMMFLYSGTDTFGALGFADGTSSTNRYRGMIGYDHNTDAMFISTAGGGSASRDVTVDSSGNVGIGTTSPAKELHVYASSGESAIQVETAGTDAGLNLIAERASASFVNFGDQDSTNVGQIYYPHSGNYMHFKVGGGERCRVKTDRFLVSSSGNDIGGSNVGGQLETAGTASFNRSDFVTMFVQRRDSDGSLIDFVQDGTTEGSISVSGATVSYNGFTGTHWSRLADNSKPTILKGTILESLDEMMDWYQVHFTIQEEGKDDIQMEKSYVLQEGESVGDVITYNHEGTDYQATIIQEDDVKHTKCKVSDTANSKRVYGVFVSWDNDDDTVNDMYVAQVGTYVIRVHSSATVEAGDMLVSNGDGTAVTLSEDTPWTVGVAKTIIGKVLSTTKIETYEDGSYTVPCSLSC